MKTRILILAALLIFASAALVNAQLPEKAEDISPLLIGESIPDVDLQSTSGNKQSLKAVVSGKPTILLFYRGGWCPYCNRHLSEISAVEDKIIELGYRLIAISPDAPENLNVSIDKNELKYDLYSDGDGALAKAMGIAFKAPERNSARLLEYSNGQNTGYLPVPSLFVIDPKGLIVFEYINPDYKTRISAEFLLAVLESLHE